MGNGAFIPFMNMATRMPPSLVGDLHAVAKNVIDSGHYIGGEFVQKMEKWMAEIHGVKVGHAVGVANGTDALTLSLAVAGIGLGDKVIVPALSFYATAGAVMRLGAIPVAVDVLPNSPFIDVTAVKSQMDDSVKAILPVHLFGSIGSLAELLSLGLPVIEDKAQMSIQGRLQGQYATLSFYPTKILGALGDAGMVVCQRESDADKVRHLASHGGKGHPLIAGQSGWNSRLDAIQAAFLWAQKKDLSTRLAKRRALAECYDAALSNYRIKRGSNEHVSTYVVRVPRRDHIAASMRRNGVETKVYYPQPLWRYEGVERGGETPNAIEFCQSALALPFHEGLSESDVVRVIETLHVALREIH